MLDFISIWECNSLTDCPIMRVKARTGLGPAAMVVRRKRGGDSSGLDLSNSVTRCVVVVVPVLAMFAGLFDGDWKWLWDDNENFTQNVHVQQVRQAV